jgi:hypothetical protein
MKQLGRNDLCLCGSGKKYKHCCLKIEEAKLASGHSGTAPKALNWLFEKYGQEVYDTLLTAFYGGLDDDEYTQIQNLPEGISNGITVNAMEWLLAEGLITIKSCERRVIDLLFDRGAPLFSIEQRHWLELLSTTPLRLYEVVGIVPGVSMTLKDVLLPEIQSVTVLEKSGSLDANLYDLMGVRILPIENHFELSGAVYPFPRSRVTELLEDLKNELEGIEPNSPLGKEITSVLIPDYWLELFVTPFDTPTMVDHTTGELLLFITDHYRVNDWLSLELALSNEADIEGSREDGWNRIFEGDDGQTRRSLSIDIGTRQERIKVSYHTQLYADQGRPLFEALAGAAVTFISREISDPKGMIANSQHNNTKIKQKSESLPPELLTKIIEEKIQQLYADWADAPLPILDGLTPHEAIRTPEGLEQVKFLLHSYEHGEIQQAKDQNREAVSYDFLWRSIGLTP